MATINAVRAPVSRFVSWKGTCKMKTLVMAVIAIPALSVLSGCGSGPDADESRNFSTISRATDGSHPSPAGPAWILTTTESADPTVGSLVYVLKTDPVEEAVLLCYRNTGRGDLQLVSARRITYDLKLWNVGGKGLKPEEIKQAIDRENAQRKEDSKKD